MARLLIVIIFLYFTTVQSGSAALTSEDALLPLLMFTSPCSTSLRSAQENAQELEEKAKFWVQTGPNMLSVWGARYLEALGKEIPPYNESFQNYPPFHSYSHIFLPPIERLFEKLTNESCLQTCAGNTFFEWGCLSDNIPPESCSSPKQAFAYSKNILSACQQFAENNPQPEASNTRTGLLQIAHRLHALSIIEPCFLAVQHSHLMLFPDMPSPYWRLILDKLAPYAETMQASIRPEAIFSLYIYFSKPHVLSQPAVSHQFFDHKTVEDFTPQILASESLKQIMDVTRNIHAGVRHTLLPIFKQHTQALSEVGTHILDLMQKIWKSDQIVDEDRAYLLNNLLAMAVSTTPLAFIQTITPEISALSPRFIPESALPKINLALKNMPTEIIQTSQPIVSCYDQIAAILIHENAYSPSLHVRLSTIITQQPTSLCAHYIVQSLKALHSDIEASNFSYHITPSEKLFSVWNEALAKHTSPLRYPLFELLYTLTTLEQANDPSHPLLNKLYCDNISEEDWSNLHPNICSEEIGALLQNCAAHVHQEPMIVLFAMNLPQLIKNNVSIGIVPTNSTIGSDGLAEINAHQLYQDFQQNFPEIVRQILFSIRCQTPLQLRHQQDPIFECTDIKEEAPLLPARFSSTLAKLQKHYEQNIKEHKNLSQPFAFLRPTHR